MTEEQYISYFEGLAAAHTAIQHSEACPRFWVADNDEYTEVVQAVRTKLNLPCLLLDQYVDDVDDSQDNFRVNVSGGFSVLVRFEQGNSRAQRDARHQARMIALQILRRFRADCRKQAFGKGVLLSPPFTGESTPVLGGIAVGWSYGFTLSAPLSVAPDDCWDD
ncbi:hypothetical protein [Arsenicibacter rosenii]|uniref:Uncharacterized protein n=1 Tax=Arsenicibacter rosenii TaxID=1750698 RepID=A0A1S2VNS0_9BACT|nr:hypothetical protein [Arsenicibacter rosenii]OIN59816.1 hypothetical protein BLX24_08130 [Arsenicibacter rosenii]